MELGFYWVKHKGQKIIAEYVEDSEGDRFFMTIGSEYIQHKEDFDDILGKVNEN